MILYVKKGREGKEKTIFFWEREFLLPSLEKIEVDLCTVNSRENVFEKIRMKFC